jgi:hypothetical protein
MPSLPGPPNIFRRRHLAGEQARTARIRRALDFAIVETPLAWTLAGDGTQSDTGNGGLGREGTFDRPRSIQPLPDGGFIFAEPYSHRIRKVNGNNVASAVAGTGVAGSTGDGGAATSALLDFVHQVSPTADGGFLVADTLNHVIRKIDSGGTITRVAGTIDVPSFSGDAGQATAATINNPRGVCALSDGSFLIADTSNHRIRKVATDGVITTVAGNGTAGSAGDNGPATSAELNKPFAIAPHPDGGYVIADETNHKIRKVSAGGTITTIAGTGVAGYSGDGGPATSARLQNPHDVDVHDDGRIVVADAFNHVVRMIHPSGLIETLAGTGVQGAAGDGAPAKLATLSYPKGVSFDANGNVLIAECEDVGNPGSGSRIRFAGQPVTPTNAVLPSITGTAALTQVLTASPGEWAGTGPVPSYQPPPTSARRCGCA